MRVCVRATLEHTRVLRATSLTHCCFPMSSSTTEYTEEEAPVGLTPADDGPASVPQPSGEGDLLGDLLNLDLPPAPAGGGYNAPMMGGGADLDLLSGDLTGLYLGGPSGTGMISGQMQGAIQTGGTGGLGALAELLGTSVAGGSYVAPKQVWKRGGNSSWFHLSCFFLPSHPHFPPSLPSSLSSLPPHHYFLPPTLSPPPPPHHLPPPPPAPPPPQMWLEAAQGKGMEIRGSWARRQGQICMDMTFTNKALSPMSDFAIQFNKNR